MKPTQKQPAVTREDIDNAFVDNSDDQAATILGRLAIRLLTERDEALREVERLSKENLLAAENIALRERVSYWVERCEAQKLLADSGGEKKA